MPGDKRILIIAGPNGAGKTTFAREFLPKEARLPTFINADLIAQGLSPLEPDRMAQTAGRLMLEQIAEHVTAGRSFAFETTLSGRGYAQHIPEWRRKGYRVVLFFLQIPQVDTAIDRVKQRVAAGGHDIPESVIRRRFAAGLRNFNEIYKSIVDQWILFDNSGPSPRKLDEKIIMKREDED